MPPHRFVLVQELILLMTDCCSSNLHQGTQSEENRRSTLNTPFHCIKVIPFHFAEKQKYWCDICRTRVLKVLRAYSDVLQIYAGKASHMEYFTHRQPSTKTITSLKHNFVTIIEFVIVNPMGKTQDTLQLLFFLLTFLSPSGCIHTVTLVIMIFIGIISLM